MANIRIAEGEQIVECAACMKKAKSVYVFDGKCPDALDMKGEYVSFEFPLCLECLGKASRMLSAIEGVGVVAPPFKQFPPGMRAAPFEQHTEIPVVGMTPGANQFHNMVSDAEGDGFEYSEAKAPAPMPMQNGKPVKVPEWAKDLSHSLKELAEEFPNGLPGSEVKKALEEIGITDKMNSYHFSAIARQYGISNEQAVSMWKAVLINKKIHRMDDQ